MKQYERQLKELLRIRNNLGAAQYFLDQCENSNYDWVLVDDWSDYARKIVAQGKTIKLLIADFNEKQNNFNPKE